RPYARLLRAWYVLKYHEVATPIERTRTPRWPRTQSPFARRLSITLAHDTLAAGNLVFEKKRLPVRPTQGPVATPLTIPISLASSRAHSQNFHAFTTSTYAGSPAPFVHENECHPASR